MMTADADRFAIREETPLFETSSKAPPASKEARMNNLVRNYAYAAASHSSKLGPASFAPGLGNAAPSA